MKKNGKSSIPSKYILTIMTLLCVMMLFVNYATGLSVGPMQTVANYIFVPMEKGISFLGRSITDNSQYAKTNQELTKENELLKQEVETLNAQLTTTRLQESELENLRQLYDLDQKYSQYKKTGAHVIAKGSSNWFETFTIDKGSKDGIKVDMNVIAGTGLVGIVTEVGTHHAIVRSIIDDTSNVSAMLSNAQQHCIVSGSLQLMTDENQISITHLDDTEDKAVVGDTVVTSNISDKYLPGLLIGYVTSIEEESKSLTKTGTITPVVDFKHLQNVLVIQQLKEELD